MKNSAYSGKVPNIIIILKVRYELGASQKKGIRPIAIFNKKLLAF